MRIIDVLCANGASVAYTDPYVPTLACGPRVLIAVAGPAARHWDLVIVHTRHPGWDLSWSRTAPRYSTPLTTSRRHLCGAE
ncbi:hypothetical protein LRE75_25080 [Streptomyces sp. 372A]